MRSLVNISEAASLGLHTMALLVGGGQQRLTNKDLASRLGRSSHHLAKVMQQLGRAGLVNSVRGPQGGFRLGKPADKVNLLEIYEAVEGPLGDGGCLLDESMCGTSGCVLGDVLRSAHRQVHEHLAKTRLSELARGTALVPVEDLVAAEEI